MMLSRIIGKIKTIDDTSRKLWILGYVLLGVGICWIILGTIFLLPLLEPPVSDLIFVIFGLLIVASWIALMHAIAKEREERTK